ncbi:PAS domain-containing protein [Antarcticibacterium sp. 1MA-6-2]|uniref:PAS domain-containing protein n=1 Tax=Antarcticibacterium sp. 1MA-6-2 TaxID=2908210 RepID=UPI001F191A91|nr:PAS domain-containing protein [Antarcticibacterium sp. 1MA-6-2]UJH91399.1 PAS domain-containing protein [Antarcticibacterium sp. 1MA-6-2]
MSSSQNSGNRTPVNQFQKEIDFLKKVANLSPDLLYIIDLQEKKVVFVNDKIKDILGFDPKIVYEQWQEIMKTILHPDDREKRLENLQKCISSSSEEIFEVEVRLKVKDA